MGQEAQIASQLRALGEYLVTERHGVMRAWRESVRKDPELRTPRNVSRSRFDDHIPAFLHALSRQLRAWPGAGIAAAAQEQERRGAEHGAHRWQEGYALHEISREWLHLHLVLFDMLEQYGSEQQYEARTMAVARRIVTMVCGNGVTRSIAEYTRLMQAEAAGRVRDLEAALSALNDLQRQRADIWREAAHELRNTVGVVTNATGILKRDDAPEPMRAKSLAALQTGVSALRGMLNDLLDLARLEAGIEEREVESIDAAALMREVCTQLQPLAAAQDLFLRTEGAPSLEVQGDGKKIQRVAANLIEAARRSATKRGVLVRWERIEQGDARHWSLSIHDGPTASVPALEGLITVPGGSQETASGPAPLPARGEGISSSLVKHLCELLDATLEYSRSDDDTCVRVLFPCQYPVR